MADKIEFRVDAVLGDYTQLQQQLNKIKFSVNVDVNGGNISNVNKQMKDMDDNQKSIIDSAYIIRRVATEAFNAVSNSVSNCVNYVKDLNDTMYFILEYTKTTD